VLLSTVFCPAGSASVELVDRIDHSDDVFDGRLRLNVVNGVEDEAAAGGEDLTAAQHLLADLCRRSEGQYVLRVYAAAPEDNALAEVCLQLGRVHAGGRALHGVQNVDTGFNE